MRYVHHVKSFCGIVRKIGLFDPSEVTSLFQAVDVTRSGSISTEQARRALKTLAVSMRHDDAIANLTLPDQVAEAAFIEIAHSIFKIPSL